MSEIFGGDNLHLVGLTGFGSPGPVHLVRFTWSGSPGPGPYPAPHRTIRSARRRAGFRALTPGLLCWVARSSHPRSPSPMAETILVAEAGRPSGSSSARRLRHDGRIPAVVYGPGVDPIPVSVVVAHLRAGLAPTPGCNAVLSLHVEGKTFLTMAREPPAPPRARQRHARGLPGGRPQRRGHRAEVTIILVGEALELQRADGRGGAADVLARSALPTAILRHRGGHQRGHRWVVRVSDLALPADVMTEVYPESMVAVGQLPAVAVEEARGRRGGGGSEGRHGADSGGGGSAEAGRES